MTPLSARQLAQEAAARSQAVVAILTARLLVRIARHRIIRWATTRESARRMPLRIGATARDDVRAAAGAIARLGGSRVIRASCLEQALALVTLMAVRGRSGRMVMGVRRGGAVLQAHAWVECDGQIVLGGGALLDGLTRLPSAREKVSPSWSR